MTILKHLTFAVLSLHVARGQETPARPTFDVATLKRHPGERVPEGYNHQITPTGITMRGVSMGYCIRLAYGLTVLRSYELVGPAWLDPPTEFEYDITARTSMPVPHEQIHLMLRALLKERMKLEVHRETRELPAYTLTVSRSEPNLRPAKAGGERKVKRGERSDQYIFTNFSMEELALQLSPAMTFRLVVDKTGLGGTFDFTLDLGRYLADPATGIVSPEARRNMEGVVARGLREQLGLTLKASREPLSVLVVDHLEKNPVEN